MNKYQNGKIYKITSKQTDDVYIGSTIQTLNDRFSRHKLHNKGSSVKLIKYDDAIIELIEDCPCETKQELLWRERYWIDNIKCVNMYRPIVTIDEKLAKDKEWNDKNKDRISIIAKQRYLTKEYSADTRKQYYENNKEKTLKTSKQYYENNKESISKREKEWYQNNKEHVSNVSKKRYSMKDKTECAIQRKIYRDANFEKIRAWDRKRNLHRQSYFGKLCKMF